jgi:uncharacterized protein with HEPN domain
MTDEIFKKELWDLNPYFSNPLHNFTNTKHYTEVRLENDPVLPTGEKLTFKLLCERYKEYAQDWQESVGKRGKEFVGKKDKLLSIYQYIDDKLYESTIRKNIPESDPRFKLIFGDVTIEQIEEAHTQFRNTIKTND